MQAISLPRLFSSLGYSELESRVITEDTFSLCLLKSSIRCSVYSVELKVFLLEFLLKERGQYRDPVHGGWKE